MSEKEKKKLTNEDEEKLLKDIFGETSPMADKEIQALINIKPDCVFTCDLQNAIKQLWWERKCLTQDLINVNIELVAQDCTTQDNKLDSMAITTYADSMRFLAKNNIIIIEKEYGRRVIGHWKKEK